LAHILELLPQAITGSADDGLDQRFEVFGLWRVGHTRYLPMHNGRPLSLIGISAQYFI